MCLLFDLKLGGFRQFKNFQFLVTAAIFDEVRTNRIYFKMGTTHGPFLPKLIHIVVVVSYKTKMEEN